MRAAIKATEIILILTQNQTYKQPWPKIQGSSILACLASVSSRVTARKLEREQKKNGRGRGRGEEETLARKPQDSGKHPLIFHGSVHL